MKKNSAITIAIMTAAVLYFAGGVQDIRRQAVPAPEAPAAVQAMVTESAPAESEAKETTAQEVKLSFDSNPTTGYTWVAVAENDVFDIQDRYTAASEEGLLGAGGTQTYRLVPKHSGSAKVTFMYQRPFDQTIQASRTYLFEVDPEMQVRFVGVAGHNDDIMAAADAGVPFEVPEITALS
jgi:predicted secreted protein